MRLTELVHHTLNDHLREGDLAIDATAGNGHDTGYLATRVGESGKVIAIDIQDSAIESTRSFLSEKALFDRVTLLAGDHSVILEQLLGEYKESVATVVFNLGYLPGSDKSVKTEAANTHQALEASAMLLRHSGMLCVTAYCAHLGGEEEAALVKQWMASKESSGWHIKHHTPASSNLPPILWLAGKP